MEAKVLMFTEGYIEYIANLSTRDGALIGVSFLMLSSLLIPMIIFIDFVTLPFKRRIERR